MHLDFWNNPLVVSSYRMKYRWVRPANTVALYLMLLLAAGSLILYKNPQWSREWPHYFFNGLMGLQFVVSGLLAVSGTSSSMKAEVMNRTLDFQRIAALSPRQILLGKLLGETLMAFLLAMATIPLSVFFWLLGGTSLPILVLMYVNLFTAIVAAGAAGLLNPLELKGGKSEGGLDTLLGVITVMVSPGPLITALAKGDPWGPLLVTPFALAGVAFLCFRVMERRLTNPLLPPLSRPLAYGVLAVVDVVLVIVFGFVEPGDLPAAQVAFFAISHTLASLLLASAVTPWRDTLHSWVWRYRGRAPRLHDLWLGDRSENILVLLTFCALGLVSLLAFLPIAVRGHTPDDALRAEQVCLEVAVTMTVMILTLGTIHQWIMLLAGKAGTGIVLTVTGVVTLLPLLLAQLEVLSWLQPLSFGTRLLDWTGTLPRPPYEWLFFQLPYVGLFLLTWVSLRQRLRALERRVENKVGQMLRPEPAG